MNKTTTILTRPFSTVARIVARGLVRGYQLLVSPILPGTCRFYPTCSSYALEALSVHGVFKGGWLALRRIARCHPWGESDFDPVPDATDAAHYCPHHGLTCGTEAVEPK